MTRWLQGWLLILVVIAVAALLLAGCARWERDPLQVYKADPKALDIPVMTLFSVGF